MKVLSIMSRKVYTIPKKSNVDEALRIMFKKNISRLIIVENDYPVGIVTIRDIMDRLGSSRLKNLPPSRIRISTVMSENLITITPDADVKEAVNIMLERNISGIPVVEREKLVGILTKTDLIKLLRNEERVSISPVFQKINFTVTPLTRIVHIKRLFHNYNLKLVPVSEENKLVGLVTERDLAKAFYGIRSTVEDPYKMDVRVRSLIAEDIMIQNPPYVEQTTSVGEAVNMMLQNKLPGLPVVSEFTPIGVIQKGHLLTFL